MKFDVFSRKLKILKTTYKEDFRTSKVIFLTLKEGFV